MPSKLDLLRQGQAIEFEPGLSGRLNKEKKTLELSNGRILNVANDRDYFPVNESQTKMSKQREYAEKGAKGSAGEFLHQYTSQGMAGGVGDWPAYLTQTGEDYAQRKAANAEVSQRISKESPFISGAATGANIATDLALTRGMSALKAAPLLTLGSAGSRIVTEPENVAAETAVGALGGKLLDAGGNWASKVATRRAANRALPAQQEVVRNSNIAGQLATDEANALQKQQFNTLSKNTKTSNELLQNKFKDETNQFKYENKLLKDQENALQKQVRDEANALQKQQFNVLKQNTNTANETKLKQFQDDLSARENQIIQNKNAYEQQKIARDSEVLKLKNEYELAKMNRSKESIRLEGEYKAAKSSADTENKRLQNEFKESQQKYEQSLKELPRLQEEAQKEYSRNVLQRVDKIEKSFPKGSRIASDELDVIGFVQEKLEKSALAGSSEAAQANKILRSLFPSGETLTAKELASRYKAIEGAIQRSNPEVKNILNEFKTHLGEKIPNILSNNMAYERVIPSFSKQLVKDIESVFKKFPQNMTVRSGKEIEKASKANLKKYIDNLTPSQFVEKIKNGEFRQELMDNLFFEGGKSLVNAQGKVIGKVNVPEYVKVVEDMFRNKLDHALARAELKMIAVETDAATRLGSNVKRTQGIAEPVPVPESPMQPSPVASPSLPGELPPVAPFNLPPPVQSPLIPSAPTKPTLSPMPIPPASAPVLPPRPNPMQNRPNLPPRPNLLPEPVAPPPQTFNPTAEPSLSPAQGMAERAGDFLEKPLLTGGKGIADNPLVKLGGLKYLLGKAALPAEAAYLGAKGLTSPSAAGEVARMTFKQAGIGAIEQWAQKYPSYHDGILENPQDRRSLTKEIENSSDIPLEQKAIMQSKINRGKPLQERL